MNSWDKALAVSKLVTLFIAVLLSIIVLADDDNDDDVRDASNLKKINWKEYRPYQEECGSCHLAYPAGLLPRRSWMKMMSELNSHFGEDAELPEPLRSDIETFLVDNSAENGSRRSKKIANTIPADQMPQRITETLFYKQKHREIPPSVWSRKSVVSPSNCLSCHPKADYGQFSEHEVRIPR